MIANKAGLIDVPWDGYLKYFRPSERFVEERRKIFASSLIARYSHYNLVELEKQFAEDEGDEEEQQVNVNEDKVEGKESSLRRYIGFVNSQCSG